MRKTVTVSTTTTMANVLQSDGTAALHSALRKTDPLLWGKDEALELLRVLASRQHSLHADFGSLPDEDKAKSGPDEGNGVFRIFRREQVDGVKLFSSNAARPPDAKTFNRLVLDTKLKGWGVKDAAHRTLISAFCHMLCQANVRIVFDISDEYILASKERVDLLVSLATQPRPAEGEFRFEIAHRWSEVALAAVTNLVELADIRQGRRLMADASRQALPLIHSILDQACTHSYFGPPSSRPEESCQAADPNQPSPAPSGGRSQTGSLLSDTVAAPGSQQRISTSPREFFSRVGADGRFLVAAAAVLEKMAGDPELSRALIANSLHKPLVRLLVISLNTEDDIRQQPAYRGDLPSGSWVRREEDR